LVPSIFERYLSIDLGLDVINNLNRKLVKLAAVLFIVVLFVSMFEYYHLSRYLSLAGFDKYRDDVLDYKDHLPILFVVQYILFYIILIAGCIPGTIILDLFAGFLFGYFFGAILIICSYSMGSIVNFLLVHYLFKGLFKNKFMKFKGLIYGANEKELLRNIIMLRLVPVIPFWVLNILASLLNIRLRVFILSTIIGIIPISIIYAIIGDGLREASDQLSTISATKLLWSMKIWLPLFGMALLLLVPNFIKKMKSKSSN